MSGVQQLPAPEFAPGDLDGLVRFVRKRIAWELRFQHDDRPHIFPLLGDRLVRVREGVTMAGRPVPSQAGIEAQFRDFEADLRELTTAPTETLAAMVRLGATSARCRPHGSEVRDAADAAGLARAAALAGLMPRVQPGELVARFAARGVVVQAIDGSLHVTPADALTAADLDVLRAHKPAILEALDRPAAVV